MKWNFLPVSLFLLGGVAHSAEICDAFPENTVSIQELAAKIVAGRADLLVTDMPPNECAPKSKAIGIISAGVPVCMFRGKLPVKAMMLGEVEKGAGVEAMGLIMRGSREDIDFARAAFKDGKDITAEYQTNRIGTHFFGEAYAWQRGDTFIVLGTHEPGYDPLEMALHLEMGTKRGLTELDKDSNSCEKKK
ncbi:hypothetical protein [Duganella sp. Root1480D1]|uniref:hypothetical protein n=1 Tax=Duganella sp. Root1480D1 TaxID=1736471 RepID=UPI0007103CD8|nr:hypothetical protein [Duganella sp. Root1480D1]KQZ27059.1 hypothetical protein ASD58_15935 [Duganella sp. Root1480D1]